MPIKLFPSRRQNPVRIAVLGIVVSACAGAAIIPLPLAKPTMSFRALEASPITESSLPASFAFTSSGGSGVLKKHAPPPTRGMRGRERGENRTTSRERSTTPEISMPEISMPEIRVQ